MSWASIYADDTNIAIALNDMVKLAADAHHELSNLTKWIRVNKLDLNLKKTEFMVKGYQLKSKNLGLPDLLKLNISGR